MRSYSYMYTLHAQCLHQAFIPVQLMLQYVYRKILCMTLYIYLWLCIPAQLSPEKEKTTDADESRDNDKLRRRCRCNVQASKMCREQAKVGGKWEGTRLTINS